MTDRPEDDPGANTEMFRAYVERGGTDSRSVSGRLPVLVGAAVVVVLVALLLVLAL